MNGVHFFSVAVLSFLGLIVGAIIAFNAKEELKQGERYFVMIQAVLFALSIYCVLWFHKTALYIAIPLSVLALILLIYLKNLNSLVYLLFGFMLAYSAVVSRTSFAVITSLIFMYGFAAASLAANSLLSAKLKKPDKSFWMLIALIVRRYFYFFVGAVVGYFSWVFNRF